VRHVTVPPHLQRGRRSPTKAFLFLLSVLAKP
jgi:hypothetical protein